MDNDDIIYICEVHECMMNVENKMRKEKCPDDELLYCTNPYKCPYCKVLTCDDLKEKAKCAINDNDSNGDGFVNMKDAVDPEHF